MGDSMSTIVLSGDTSGAITIAAPAVAGTNTLTLPASTGTFVVAGQNSAITAGTAQNSTSGTSIDFTSIPSWVKRVTVMLNGVSTNGSSVIQVQLGDSGGIETTGYVTMAGLITTTNNTTRGAVYTSGFPTAHGGAAGDIWRGAMVFNSFGSNIWVGTGTVYNSADSITMTSGTKTLTDTLDRVRITTVNGTDTFDAGSINILYE
jgi:hypothetical protein